MKYATVVAALALTATALSVQGREPAPLERYGRAGAIPQQGIVLNSVTKSAGNVALVQGRGSPALAVSSPAAAKSRVTQRDVSRVLGRG